MDSQNQIPKPAGEPVEIEADSNQSVDDFIRELEAKERDLHITADLSIEIEDANFELVESLPLIASTPAEVSQPPIAKPVAASQVPQANTGRQNNLENEIASLKLRVFELRNERNEVQEKSDRRLKDFENYRYRVDRERRGAFIDQIANLASQMLPVLDNLNRAIDTTPRGGKKLSPEFERLFDGIVLVNQQLNEVLAGMGVTPIATVGETFDPHFHEAVATEDQSELPPNTVCEELLRGYRIGNKVVRHSMVKVVAAAPSDGAAASDDLDGELDGTLA